MKKHAVKRMTAHLLTATLLTATLLSACTSPKEGEQPKQTGKAPSANPSAKTEETKGDTDPFGKISPPVEITIGRTADNVKFEPGQSIDKNVIYDLYEEKLGIKLKNEWVVAGNQYDSKTNVAIASGNIPDMFAVNGVQLKNLVDAGMVEDLTEVYNKYASPDIKRIFSEDGGYAVNAASFDGKMYGFPIMVQGYWNSLVLWIRQDWLDKLQLQPPKTMDDVVKIAVAFTKNDPDGNGKNDTYGLGLSKELAETMFGFFNSYHAYPGSWIKDASGKTVYGSIQPEMRAPLLKLAELYKQGIIDKEFGVKDVTKMNEAVNAGKIGMLYGTANLPLFGIKDSISNNPDAEWNAYSLPSSDGEPAKAFVGPTANSYWVVKKGFSKPEAVVKLGNFWLEHWFINPVPEYGTNEKTGIRYYEYAIVTPSPPMIHIKEHQNIKSSLVSKVPWDKSKGLQEWFYLEGINKYLADPKNMNDKDVKNGWAFNRTFGTPHAGLEVLDGYFKNNLTVTTALKVSSTTTMAEKKPTLDKMEQVMLTKVILGEAGIEEFDKFVKDWNKLGGEQMTKEVNEY